MNQSVNKQNQKLSTSEMGRLDVQNFKESEKFPIVVVLDNIRSMNNIGSVFRTCDAFRIAAIYLCGITAQPPHREIEKTALGATLSVDWKYFETTKDAILSLQNDKFSIFAVEQTQNSIPLHQFDYQSDTKIAVIFGNEVFGVEQQIIDLCSHVIEIPQFGTKHSLNVSISAGIVLWHLVSGKLKIENDFCILG